MAKDALRLLSSRFMKAIHIELSNEAINLIMPKISRQNNLLELINIFDDKLHSGLGPISYLIKLIILTKKTITFRISKVFAMNPATSVV